MQAVLKQAMPANRDDELGHQAKHLDVQDNQIGKVVFEPKQLGEACSMQKEATSTGKTFEEATATREENKLVSVESPYGAPNIFRFYQQLQYTVLANKHSTFLGYATFTPHLCNPQIVLYGVQAYIGDFVGKLPTTLFGKETSSIGREKTLDVTMHGRRQCRELRVYNDMGVSPGMQRAIDYAKEHNIPVAYCQLPDHLMRHVVGKSVASTIGWGVGVSPFAISGFVVARGVYRLVKSLF